MSDDMIFNFSMTPTYGALNPENEGVWCVISENDKPVGVLWADYVDGGGASFVDTKSSINAQQIVDTVSAAYVGGLAPMQMFSLVSNTESPVFTFSQPELGKLSELKKLKIINEEEETNNE